MDMYRIAASGGSTIKPASPAIFKLIPRNMMTMVTIHPFALPRKLTMTATRKPLFSATEEPMTATSTMPSGAKPEKFVMTFVQR